MQRTRARIKYRNYLHSIPIFCLMFLLFGLAYSIVFIPPVHDDKKVYATEDYSIMPTALSYTALTIGGDAVDKQVTVAPGGVGYRNHTITIATSNFSNYTLTISGPVGLTGGLSGTTITGADGNTPTNMASNTWGYSYGQTTAIDARTYQSFTGGSQVLASSSTTAATDTTQSLSFAVKFANDAVGTSYTGTVTLSLIATPKS